MNVINLLLDSLRDNKKLIIALYALFIIVFIVAWFLTASKMQVMAGDMSISSTPVNGNVGPLELFINNAWGGIVTYVYSILFGIFAVLILVYNAYQMAAFGQLFNSALPNGGLMYIIYLIPHGIFEITATVLQSAAGIMLFIFIWRFIKALRSKDNNGASDAFEKTKKILIQSIVILIFSIVLVLIAAPIESYFSVPFSQFVMGILGLN